MSSELYDGDPYRALHLARTGVAVLCPRCRQPLVFANLQPDSAESISCPADQQHLLIRFNSGASTRAMREIFGPGRFDEK